MKDFFWSWRPFVAAAVGALVGASPWLWLPRTGVAITTTPLPKPMAWITVHPWVCDWNWWRGQNPPTWVAPDSYAIFSHHSGCTRYDYRHGLCTSTKRLVTWGCREHGQVGQSQCNFSLHSDWRCGDPGEEVIPLAP